MIGMIKAPGGLGHKEVFEHQNGTDSLSKCHSARLGFPHGPDHSLHLWHLYEESMG